MTEPQIFVFGAGGMLGKAVVAACKAKLIDGAAFTHGDVDICDHAAVLTWLQRYYAVEGDVVINCAGVRPDIGPVSEMVRTNAAGPWALLWTCEKLDLRLIQVSTDCVVGEPRDGGPHDPRTLPCPVTPYGRSKLAGEVTPFGVPSSSGHTTVRTSFRHTSVRTSFIGPDHGLWRWVAEHPSGDIDCWANALWSGSTVWAVADALVTLAMDGRWKTIEHLATPPIAKGEVVRAIIQQLGRENELLPAWTTEPRLDRSLYPTLLLKPVRAALREVPEWSTA